VGSPCPFTFSFCLNPSHPVWSTGGECLSLACFSRYLDLFLPLCSEVGECRSLAFLWCIDLSPHPNLLVCENIPVVLVHYILTSFCAFQTMHVALGSYMDNVWLILYGHILLLLIHFQLSISRNNTHHIMIGRFLISAFLMSNIENSDNTHSGILCLSSSCLVIYANL
jgi:hypothetical protein